MTETSLAASAAIKVWVIPPTALNAKGQQPQPGDAVAGYVFPWSWGWKESKQLIPTQSVDVASSMGTASFRLLRATRQEIGRTKYAPLSDGIIVGAWICITAGTALTVDGNGKTTDQLDPTAILWVGWISAIEQEELAGSAETIGSVSALGLGHLLEKRQIYGWAQAPEGTDYGVAMNAPPQANIAGPENHIIGNAVLGTYPGGAVFVFARMPADCAPALLTQNDPNVWSRWRLLQHMAAFCTPNMGPGFSITIAPTDNPTPGVDPSNLAQIGGWLNDTRYPEVFDLQSLTWKGALDVLIPDSLGLGWYITVAKSGWTVNIYSISDAGNSDPTYFGLPINPTITPVPLSTEPIVGVTLRSSADDMPDELVYESVEPCLWCFTVSFADKNLGKMWTAQQEIDYKAAASGATNYPTDPTKQKEINAAVRAGPGFRDVFTKYGLNSFGGPNNRGILRRDQPVTGSGAPTLALIPNLVWNQTTLTLTVDQTTSRLPYLPTARFQRTLPWPVGLWADGTDHRDATSKATPQYHQPCLFRYDVFSSTNGGYPWVDLLARNGRPGFISVQLDVDDRSPALRVTANPPELLAYKHWAGSPTPAPSDVDPETDGKALDYTKLVATVAMESDQKIQVIISRPGTQANPPTAPGKAPNVRRSLIIRDDKLHCWLTLKNTILALKGDNGGAPDFVTTPGSFPASMLVNDASAGTSAAVALRNDWPIAQRRANMLAAFVFRKRTAVTIERARADDQPTWAKLGIIWSKVVEVAASTTGGTAVPEVSTACGTCVVEIVRTYGDKPRMRASTGLPTMVSATQAGFGGSASASGGGKVSVVGGGPVPVQIADLSRRVGEVERGVVKVAVQPPKGGASASSVYTLQIGGGNTLSDGTTLGIKNATSAIATVPSIYDPTTNPACIDGIGYATLFKDGTSQGKVMVANYNGDGSPYQLALSANQIVLTNATTISIPLAGDPTQSLTCYLPYSP